MAASATGQLQEFYSILLRRRWQVILPAAFVITGGIVFAVIAPRKYTVTTRVELRETSIQPDPEFEQPEDSATTRELDNIEHHIKHNERIADIIESELDQWPRYLNANYRDRREFIRDKVIKNLDVNVQPRPHNRGSTFVDIAYTDSDKVRAEHFLTELIGSWVDNVVERDANTVQSELDILQNQVMQAQAKFTDLNGKYVSLTKEMGIDPSQPLAVGRSERAADPYWDAIRSLEDDIQKVRTDLAHSDGELKDVKDKLTATPPTIEAPQTATTSGIADKIAAAEAQALALRQEQEPLTPLNSKWPKLQQQIDDIEKQVAQMRLLDTGGTGAVQQVPNPGYLALIQSRDAHETEVAGLQSQLDSLTQRLGEAQVRAQKRSDDYGELFDLYGQLDTARKELGEKQAAMSSRQTTMELITGAWAKPYDIVDPPVAPEDPSAPNVWLILTFATLAGISIGLVVASLAEFGRPGFRTVSEVTHAMTVPVLGAINAIVTDREHRYHRRRRLIVGVSCVVLIGGLLWTTYLWQFQRQVLPTELLQAIDDLQFKLM